MQKKKLGIIGGIGPLATVYFADLVIRLTKADSDQEHIPMLIYNDTDIPDRTEYILDNTKENPLPLMIRDAKKLEAEGCDVLAMPCNTAHYFFDELQANVGVPLLSILEESVCFAEKKLPGLKKLGVLATDGTLRSGAYHHTLEKHGLQICVPSEREQAALTEIIYGQVKASRKIDIDGFLSIAEGLGRQGAEAVILGCTELSVIRGKFGLYDTFFVDSSECLARAAVTACGKEIAERPDF